MFRGLIKTGGKRFLETSDIILDLGTNTGCYAVSNLLNGCGKGMSVEASKEPALPYRETTYLAQQQPPKFHS